MKRSLSAKPFPSLVRSIPIANHAIEVESEFWKNPFKTARQQKLYKAIFGKDKKIWLSRRSILNSKPSLQKCAQVLLWGYSSGMRGRQHMHFLKNLPKIAQASKFQGGWDEYFGNFKRIKKLGISTITKLAYFHKIQFESCPALILDDRIIKILRADVWIELSDLNKITRDRSSGKYLDYLKAMKNISKKMRVRPAQLEFFLFSLGGSFMDPLATTLQSPPVQNERRRQARG